MRTALIAAVFLAGCNVLVPTASPPTPSSGTPSSPPTAAPTPSSSATAAAVGFSGLPIVAAGTFAPTGLWVIVQNYLLMSADGGATWWTSSRSLPFDSSSNDARETLLDVVDARHIWALTSNNLGTGVSGDTGVDKLVLTLHRSSDGGRSWTDLKIAGSYPGTIQALHFVDARNGYLLISPGRFDTPTSTILRTTDSGTTWHQTGSDGLLGTEVAVRGTSIWAGSAGDAGPVERRVFAVSHDDGKTWSDVALPGIPPVGQWATFLQPPTFPDATTGVVLVSRSDGTDTTDIYRSDDAGDHWARISTSTAASLAALSSTHWLRPSTTPGQIDGTDDAGLTWAPFVEIGLPPRRITWISFSDQRNGAALAVTGAETLCQFATGCLAAAGLYVTADGGSTWHRPGFWSPPGPAPGNGRLAVVNGPRPVIVSVSTEWGSGSGMWLVPPNSRLLLLDGPANGAGLMEILDGANPCELLGAGYFDAMPATLTMDGPATGPGYKFALSAGTSIDGPLVTGFFAGCSG